MTPINNGTSRLSNLETKLDMFIQEMRDFKQEMRDRDNQRAAEIMELRQKQDSDIKELRVSIDSMGKHVRNLSVAAIVGVGASVIAVVVLAGTIAYSVLSR